MPVGLVGAVGPGGQVKNASGAEAGTQFEAVWPNVLGQVLGGLAPAAPQLPSSAFTTPLGYGNAGPADAYYRLIMSETGLVLYLRFDETAGTNAADALALDPGVYTGGFTLNVAGALHDTIDAGVLLDGTTGYVSVAATNLAALGNTFSWESWVKRTATGGTPQRMYDRNPSGDFQIFINNNLLDHWSLEAQADGQTKESTTTLDTNWHHLVATKSGATAHLYQDGVDVTGVTGTDTTIVGATGSLIIGQQRTLGGGIYNGSLDEYALYNVALTPVQVMTHYLTGIGLFGATWGQDDGVIDQVDGLWL